MDDFIKKEENTYTRTNMVYKDDYIEQMGTLLSIKENITIEDAISRVSAYVGKAPNLTVPKVKHYIRDRETRDRSIVVSNWDDYLRQSLDDKEQMAPSMTGYINKEEEGAILADMVTDGMVNRKLYLAEKFKAKTKDDVVAEDFNQVMQIAAKTVNNSVTGILGSEGTVLNNRSGHASLTSTARIVTSSTNSMIERMLGSNRHYSSTDIILTDVGSILANTDRVNFQHIIDTYTLTIPSVEHIITTIKESAKGYIPVQVIDHIVRPIVEKLCPLDRAIYCYTGDLNQVRVLNEDLMRGIFKGLLTKHDSADIVDVVDRLNEVPEDILNLLHHVYMTDLKGLGTLYEEMDTAICTRLYLSAVNVLTILRRYQDLFRTILTVTSLAPNVAYIKTMIRTSIPASDTDSALYTVEEWVKWYRQDKPLYSEESVGIAGIMGYLVSQSTDHVIRQLSINMGIKMADIDILKMKSEYTFSFFGVMSNAKHYFATPIIIERNVLKKSYIDTKGVNLKNSNTPEGVRKAATRIEQDLIDCATGTTPISTYKILRDIRNVEQDILNSLADGKHEFLRFNTIKAHSAYKDKDPTKTPYQWSVFWNTTWGLTANHTATPPYKCLKIPTILKNKSAIVKWIDQIEDPQTKQATQKWITSHKKTMLKTIYVPMEYIASYGIPKDIMSVIDRTKVVLDVANMMYLVLETLSVYPRNNVILSDEYPCGWLENKIKEWNEHV